MLVTPEATVSLRTGSNATGRSSAGFSLIEVLVTLALIGVVLAMLLPRVGGALGGPDPAVAAREVATVVREARGRAIADSRATEVLFDLEAGTFGRVGGATRRLRDGLQVRIDAAGIDPTGGTVARIRFGGDGSSTGARIIIAHDGREIAVNIGWLTGRVTLDE